jgi:hypothetical protein
MSADQQITIRAERFCVTGDIRIHLVMSLKSSEDGIKHFKHKSSVKKDLYQISIEGLHHFYETWSNVDMFNSYGVDIKGIITKLKDMNINSETMAFNTQASVASMVELAHLWKDKQKSFISLLALRAFIASAIVVLALVLLASSF